MTMGTLPLLIEHPVRCQDGALHLALPDRAPVALVGDTGTIGQFNAGWRAESLFTLFDPLWVLVLRHEDGTAACWYVAGDGRLAAAPHLQPEPERRDHAGRLQEVALWLGAVAGAAIRLPVPDAVRAYAGLPPAVRRELDALLEEPVSSLPDAAPPQDHLAAEVLPILCEPVDGTRGYRIGHPGALLPLAVGTVPIALQPGWRLFRIQTVLAPLLTLSLHHEDGSRAVWFSDLNGQVIGHHVGLLPIAYKRHLLRIVAPVIEPLWAHAALGKPAALPDLPNLIGDVPPADLGELVPLHLDAAGEEPKTQVRTLDAALPPGLCHIIPTDHGLRACEEASLAGALLHGFHGELDRLLQTGRMRWPSPLDGSMLESDGFALLLNNNCFAYRFRDEQAGFVFHVVATGTHFYNRGIYFPTANLLVARTPALAADCLRHLGRGRDAILRHLLAFGGQLAEGSRIPRDETVQQYFGGCAIHIGHYVWQDLSGLAYLLRRVPDERRLPHLQLFDRRSTHQYFGPEERIFPVFADRLTRHEVTFDAYAGEFYRRNQRVITYTAISVPAEVGRLVRAAAEATPELRAVCRAADAARARPAPVILFGIRVGNRTMDDMEDFAVDLLRRLGSTFPGCTVILDGLNDDADRGGDVPDPAPGSGLEEELRIGRTLRSIAADLDVQLIDNINRSALRSAVWCSRADCFVAPLGAALAKYRWVCNTPGLVLTSRWNLEHRGDLRIYDSPAALEGSSEMLFNSRDHVRDLDPERDAGGHDGRGNFVVERDAIFAQLADLVRRHVALRPALSGIAAPDIPPASAPPGPPMAAAIAQQQRRQGLRAWIRRMS